MENTNVFTYKYSPTQNKEVEYIRKKYLPAEESKIETLRKLDWRVQTAGLIPGLVIGVIGCLLFGIGMCFGLDVFGGADWLTLLFCFIGIAVMAPAYPINKYIEAKTKAELTPEILRLSEEIIGQQPSK